jgi:VPS4-like protein
MAPRRRVMQSKHFKAVGGSGTFVPCAENDDDAFEMTFDEFEDASTLRNPPLVDKDFLDALARIKPSVDPATLARYEEWTRCFGTQ